VYRAAGTIAAMSPPGSDARWVVPVVLEGQLVRLEPLSLAHLDDLAAVGLGPAIWHFTIARPMDRDGLRAWLSGVLAAAASGGELPFATIDLASGRAVGSTRFMAIAPEHRRLEVGWTWLAPAWQRRGLNREAKLLQLEHAFERLGAIRVEFKTDATNERARAALEGIGARFEGIFRNHMVMPDGRLRHSAWYSVIADEWPDVKVALVGALRR